MKKITIFLLVISLNCISSSLVSMKREHSFIISNALLTEVDKEMESIRSSDKKKIEVVEAVVLEPIQYPDIYKCSDPDCRFTTNHGNRMKSHEKRHQTLESTSRNVFHCEKCDFLTEYIQVFKNHKKTHVQNNTFIRHNEKVARGSVKLNF